MRIYSRVEQSALILIPPLTAIKTTAIQLLAEFPGFSTFDPLAARPLLLGKVVLEKWIRAILDPWTREKLFCHMANPVVCPALLPVGY